MAAEAGDSGKESAVSKQMRIAIPCAEGCLAMHFGHCEQFAIVDVRDGRAGAVSYETPPPHEPGVLPRWLAGLKVNVVIAGGMGARAQGLFEESGIQVVVGAPSLPVSEIVSQYLAGTLAVGDNVCDH